MTHRKQRLLERKHSEVPHTRASYYRILKSNQIQVPNNKYNDVNTELPV